MEVKMNEELERLITEARRRPPMTREETDAQCRSWVIGEMLIEHDDMTREKAELIYEQVAGK